MRTPKPRRRPVESVRNRLVERYVRGLARNGYVSELDFFGGMPQRSIGVRFRDAK